MKWSMDTHKYMSEITRTALQVIAKHGITSESKPEEIDAVEKELVEKKYIRIIHQQREEFVERYLHILEHMDVLMM